MNKIRSLPFISISLVTINVGMYLLCLVQGDIVYARGCLRTYEIFTYGQYGRMLWSMFLHAGSQHLFGNMIILLCMGAMIEREIGHISYAVIYMASGLNGNLLSLAAKIANNDPAASIGASGAIFGLNGLLLAIVLFSRKRIQNVTPIRVILMICLSLYSGLVGGNVDNLAHIGGLVTGFVLGMTLIICRRIFR
ncbi:MAG: rhomboid family intramembrane serine protease [bacterium]|nr:rhomboid family intramembrane serine protease [bacterium]MCM1374690.1 rhomboid family intramembrane serine protease [Muribaculum sp.]